MEETNSDQAQITEGTESEEVTTQVEATEDNQETPVEGQSNNEGEEADTGSKLYKLPDGREVTADQLHSEYAEKLLPEFTRKSQRLAELEKAEAQRKTQADVESRKASDELLKDVPADVKEVIVQVARPLFEQQMAKIEEDNRLKEEQRQRDEADNRFKTQLSDLSAKYNGKNPDLIGIPKFDKAEVLAAMQEPDNKIFDPEVKFMEIHRAKFLDLEVRKALQKQKGGNKTESTGVTASSERGTKSTGKTPKTLREASQAFLDRMASIQSD